MARFGPIPHNHVEIGRRERVNFHGGEDHMCLGHEGFQSVGTRDSALGYSGVKANLKVKTWNECEDTFCEAHEFCPQSVYVGRDRDGARVF